MHWIERLIADYGLFAVIAGAFIEGEAVVSIAGFAAHQGLLSPLHVAIAAFLGAFSCDQAIFHLARRSRESRPVLAIAGSRPGMAAVGLVARMPTGFAFLYRFIFGMRLAGPAMLALSGMSSVRFALLGGSAAAVWATVYTTVGYVFGQAAEAAIGRLGKFEERALVAVLVAVIAIAAAVALRRRLLRRRAG